MKSNKYIKFTGLNTDEIKKFLTNGEFKIEQIREGDGEKGIPHWFEYKIQFSYLGTQRELDVHQNDVIIEFEYKTLLFVTGKDFKDWMDRSKRDMNDVTKEGDIRQ